MKEKKGFTLIELVVSIVLVSIVLIALLGSLLQIRDAYNLIHKNSDVLVYSSSISRVLNSDINKNNGIRYANCTSDGKKCSLILGNDARRELTITDSRTNINDSPNNINHENNKSTLKYLDTTIFDKSGKEEDKKIVYIKTLEIDKYNNLSTNVITSNGYSFYSLSAKQYEYTKSGDATNIDVYTVVTIKISDEVDVEDSQYDIKLYGAGRYDYSNNIEKVYKIELDNAGAVTSGTTVIDEVFGVGFFKGNSAHTKSDEIDKIDPPTKNTEAFLGYYYKPAGLDVETRVIDASGNITSSSRIFKNDIIITNPSQGKVYAKWGTCNNIVNGNCVEQSYNVTLDYNDGSGVTDGYNVKYQSQVPNVVVPQREGYTFEGFIDSLRNKYNDRTGAGIRVYDKNANATLVADWVKCEEGTYSLLTSNSCTDCAIGSITSVAGSGKCLACQNGTTTSAVKSSSCNTNCSNNNGNILSWEIATWNDDNTLNNRCKIRECKTGYDGEISQNKCTVNSYTIQYELNGGTFGTSHPTSTNYDTEITINNPTRDGYTFTGWTFNGNITTAMYGDTFADIAWTDKNSLVTFTKFKNLIDKDNATVKMFANWRSN